MKLAKAIDLNHGRLDGTAEGRCVLIKGEIHMGTQVEVPRPFESTEC